VTEQSVLGLARQVRTPSPGSKLRGSSTEQSGERYELDDVTAPRRRSAVARPHRENASAAAEMPPSHRNMPIPRAYRRAIAIQFMCRG